MRGIAWAFDTESRELTTAGLVAVMALAALLLAPLLIYPLGPDNALFFVSGQKIVTQGAVHYTDMVDVKPPMIYYFNALAITLFGDSTTSPRILDLLLQLATIFGLITLLRRVSGTDIWGIVAAIIYPILYIGVNNDNTTQTESFLALFLVASALLYFRGRTPLRFALIGLLCGVAAMFKFTFLITIGGFLLADLLMVDDTIGNRLRLWLAAAGGVLAALLLFLLYLTIFDAWSGFDAMRVWTSHYTGMGWGSPSAFISDILTKLPTNLADEYSMTMLVGTLVAIWIGWRGERIERFESSGPEQEGSRAERMSRLLLVIMTLQFLLLLVTIAIEGKWMHYHLTRVFGPGTILASFGLIYLGQRVRTLRNRHLLWLVIPVAAFLLLGLSPVTRYIFHALPAFQVLSQGPGAYDDYYAHRRADDEWGRAEIDEIGGKVRETLTGDETIWVASGTASLLYLSAGVVPTPAVYHSGFLIAPFAPEEWREGTKTFLLERRPRIIVLQTSDRMPMITSIDSSSYETVQRWPKVWEMISSEYERVDSTNAFLVYERTIDRPRRYPARSAE